MIIIIIIIIQILNDIFIFALNFVDNSFDFVFFFVFDDSNIFFVFILQLVSLVFDRLDDFLLFFVVLFFLLEQRDFDVFFVFDFEVFFLVFKQLFVMLLQLLEFVAHEIVLALNRERIQIVRLQKRKKTLLVRNRTAIQRIFVIAIDVHVHRSFRAEVVIHFPVRFWNEIHRPAHSIRVRGILA